VNRFASIVIGYPMTFLGPNRLIFYQRSWSLLGSPQSPLKLKIVGSMN